jgi:hypothetical protein
MARMPSTRKRAPTQRPAQPAVRKEPAAERATCPETPTPTDKLTPEQLEAVRAGGFHESSYELKSGLEVSESEWPADTTIPGALGER